ncbi:polyprenyl synthetase family protein [Streptomyces sp. ET3-23]|uniref:polyprenyl synthetase family protein n=1 Tax=Streptomyces sp. ET3-23 TaxID=2885643 RepID=UPI001D10AD6B|nr:polyprenyl synthetase family protein [Streptomyces sp. ET3-23]MCC2276043.1 polyprenyl synthetase family protein [Streptomyces sp. ET3-23]
MNSRTTPSAARIDIQGVRTAVDAHLADYLDAKEHAAAHHDLPTELAESLRGFVMGGGKRLRPVLCACGWYAGGGTRDTTVMVKVAASLEMFHAFALIHDDIMDRSATRHGRPTVHRVFTRRLDTHRSPATAERLGAGAAILVGDLALVWSDELLHTAGVPTERFTRLLPLVHAMRTEVIHGQYLDLAATADVSGDIAAPLKAIRYKTAKYTVERPLHIGATLAGADPRVLQPLSAYALRLGEAFQLRDDLLGVFGDPHRTGKSRLDDLREGKHTVLLALALQRAEAAQRETLRLLIGNPALDEDDAARIRTILTATGARTEVERMIRARCAQARRVLLHTAFPTHAVQALRRIVDATVARTS